MELKINEVQLPAPITFNYEEMKAELLQKAEIYESMVYTEDKVQDAKKDRATLNRLKKALNDERLRREKEYMQPFATFKAQIAEIISIIDKPCAVIDSQVKAYEEKQIADKRNEIVSAWCGLSAPKWLQLEKVFDDRWLNKSVTIKKVTDEMIVRLDQIAKDMNVLTSLSEYSFEALEFYKKTLDLAAAISEAHRLTEQAKAKAAWEAEQEKRKADVTDINVSRKQAVTTNINDPDDIENVAGINPVEPDRQWIGFQALLSVAEAKALGAWMKTNNIKYKAI